MQCEEKIFVEEEGLSSSDQLATTSHAKRVKRKKAGKLSEVNNLVGARSLI